MAQKELTLRRSKHVLVSVQRCIPASARSCHQKSRLSNILTQKRGARTRRPHGRNDNQQRTPSRLHVAHATRPTLQQRRVSTTRMGGPPKLLIASALRLPRHRYQFYAHACCSSLPAWPRERISRIRMGMDPFAPCRHLLIDPQSPGSTNNVANGLRARVPVNETAHCGAIVAKNQDQMPTKLRHPMLAGPLDPVSFKAIDAV